VNVSGKRNSVELYKNPPLLTSCLAALTDYKLDVIGFSTLCKSQNAHKCLKAGGSMNYNRNPPITP